METCYHRLDLITHFNKLLCIFRLHLRVHRSAIFLLIGRHLSSNVFQLFLTLTLAGEKHAKSSLSVENFWAALSYRFFFF